METFSLITFNCFGVPGPYTHRRLLMLAAALNQSDATVVCLQEVQAHPYRALLTRACAASFPHYAFTPHLHAPKGGLLTLSRAPIVATVFEPYHDRGLWYTPALADVALAKGVLHTSFAIAGMSFVVLNTHLSANYRGDWLRENAYLRTERNQLQQLAALVQRQPTNAFVIACGDFNVPRGSDVYTAFVRESGMVDPLANDTRSTYRPMLGVPARFALPIDYTFVRVPNQTACEVSADLCFAERVPFGGRDNFLSDHIGVALQATWHAPV